MPTPFTGGRRDFHSMSVLADSDRMPLHGVLSKTSANINPYLVVLNVRGIGEASAVHFIQTSSWATKVVLWRT